MALDFSKPRKRSATLGRGKVPYEIKEKLEEDLDLSDVAIKGKALSKRLSHQFGPENIKNKIREGLHHVGGQWYDFSVSLDWDRKGVVAGKYFVTKDGNKYLSGEFTERENSLKRRLLNDLSIKEQTELLKLKGTVQLLVIWDDLKKVHDEFAIGQLYPFVLVMVRGEPAIRIGSNHIFLNSKKLRDLKQFKMIRDDAVALLKDYLLQGARAAEPELYMVDNEGRKSFK